MKQFGAKRWHFSIIKPGAIYLVCKECYNEKMITEFEVVSIPLEKNDQGVIRVTGTRVSLDSILNAYYNEGATPEEIVMRFPTCSIENIYTIISWALNHTDFVTNYLASQNATRQQLEREIKQSYPSSGLRERLIARSHQNHKK
ncbi:MAG: DUF433 domain-containing protein [Chloroflexota bacterium]